MMEDKVTQCLYGRKSKKLWCIVVLFPGFPHTQNYKYMHSTGTIRKEKLVLTVPNE